MTLSLDERQTAVLAALGRHGGDLTLHELQRELPGLGMAAILRTLDLLERRGVTRSSGERAWAFVADHEAWDGPPFAPDELTRFSLAA